MRKSSAARTPSPRADRVGDSIRQALGLALLRDVSDSRLTDIGITDVRVTADIRHAKIYWQLLDLEATERERNRAARAIASAAGFFRSVVARELDLKFTPELTFAYDDSISRGREMDMLLYQLAADGGAVDEKAASDDAEPVDDDTADDDDNSGDDSES
jgi:ribosome-binding factor A